MIAQVNGFRYGEISRKQAGRYAEDGYQQGCFQFRNAMTMYDSGMTRRYPLRPLITCGDTEIYTIHPFRISEGDNYVLGFGRDKDEAGTGMRNTIVVYGWKDGKFSEITRIHDSSNAPIFAVDNGTGGFNSATLSETVCQGMRFAQYYTRMYIVSHEFRTFWIEIIGGVVSTQIATFVFNNNSKATVYFIKSDTATNGKVLFKDRTGKYYEDINFKTAYTLQTGETAEVANNSYISSFNDFVDNSDLNNGAGTYPNVVAVINDSLYFANTTNSPSAIWKSRTLGSSQWIGSDNSYTAESMHDFTQFQVVATEETKLKDSDEWPMSDSGYYETYNGEDAWYAPDKENGAYTYAKRLRRDPRYYLANGNDMFYYYTDAEGKEQKYKFFSPDEKPKSKYEETKGVVYYNPKDETQTFDTYSIKDTYNYFPTSDIDHKLPMASDYVWVDTDGNSYTVDDTEATIPVKKPLRDYDLSDSSKLYETETTVDFVTTDSCGVRMELNTGANDEVRFITAGCGKIVVGISTCEKTLPANFNAVSNMYSSHYSDYGSLAIEPIKLGRSFFFFQTGRKIRELYLSDGYMEDADVTALNHDIFDEEVIDTVGKNTPDPSLYSVLANGQIVQITYDRNGGLNSFARWDSTAFSFKSLACTRRNDKEILMTVVKCEGKYYICYFMEPTDEEMNTDIYVDRLCTDSGNLIEKSYTTLVETVYAEVYDGANTFGRNKKAKTMYIRPYHCGHIQIGNDIRQLNRTNIRLGDSDYSFNVSGSMEKNFSIKMQSEGNEPMTILAIAWEA